MQYDKRILPKVNNYEFMNKKYNQEQIKEFISRSLFDEKILLNKNQSWPKISTVTPCFNTGRFLEKTILSVLNQNYPNHEFIIIDGGSTDGSLEIIKKYEKYLAFWVSEKDRGQSDAINKGFSMARGEIINVQETDDIFLPGAFYKIAELFRDNPDKDIIYGDRLDIDENDTIIRESKFIPFSLVVYQYDGMLLGPQSAFWKRDLFSKIGMFNIDLHYTMDYDFFLKAAKTGVKFKYVPYFFSAMRRHSNSKTEKFLGTPSHQKELDVIDKKYGRKKWLNFPLKIYSLLHRSISYFLQGDLDYVLNGLKRRAKNKSILSGR